MSSQTLDLTQIVMNRIEKNIGRYKGNRGQARYEIHATDLINNFCLRRFLLCYQHGLAYSSNKKFPAKTYLTFRIGDKIEEIAREILAGYKPAPIGLYIKDILICGSPDIVVVDMENDIKFFVECKSIKKEAYDKLVKPVQMHELQLQTYLWLANRHFQEFYGKAGVILYIPKQESTPLVKAFQIEYDESIGRRFESVVVKIKRFLKLKELPRRFCKNEKMARSFDCNIFRICEKETNS